MTSRIAPPNARTNLALWLACGMVLLSALPFVVAHYPQLTDYPSHLARYYVMLDAGRNAVLERYYEFRWQLTGNLGVDLLMVPLGKIMGVEPAGRFIGATIPPLTGVGIIAVQKALGRPIGPGSLLAFALIWSPAMGMGFYNFCLALALALFAFALWVRVKSTRSHWLLFVPISMAVWLCHASGWGVLGVLVFGYEWHNRRNLGAIAETLPLAAPILLMLLGGGGAGMIGADILAGSSPGYKLKIWHMALRDRIWLVDVASLALILAVLTMALVARRFDGRLGWAAAILLVLTIVMPRHFGGGDYADYRLIAVGLMVACMAIDWTGPGWAPWLASALFVVRIAVTSASWHAESRDFEATIKALDHVPEGARIAAAVAVDSDGWDLGPRSHAASYATVRRDALVNTHFAIPGVHMLRLKNAPADFIDPSQHVLQPRGKPVELADFKPARYADYLWYFGEAAPASLPPGARIILRTPTSLLAKLNSGQGRNPGAAE